MLDDCNCPTLRRYRSQLSEDGDGNKLIAGLALDDVDGGEGTSLVEMNEGLVRLDDDDIEAEQEFEQEREAVVNELVRLCEDEMSPPIDILALRHVFDHRTYDWKQMKSDPAYFEDALMILATQLQDVFRTAGADWISSRDFVARQAQSLRRLFCGGVSLIDWRATARLSSETDFWTRVRENQSGLNILWCCIYEWFV